MEAYELSSRLQNLYRMSSQGESLVTKLTHVCFLACETTEHLHLYGL